MKIFKIKIKYIISYYYINNSIIILNYFLIRIF